jgi:hypothetical protein
MRDYMFQVELLVVVEWLRTLLVWQFWIQLLGCGVIEEE